jgi:hypothetical protein
VISYNPGISLAAVPPAAVSVTEPIVSLFFKPVAVKSALPRPNVILEP